MSESPPEHSQEWRRTDAADPARVPWGVGESISAWALWFALLLLDIAAGLATSQNRVPSLALLGLQQLFADPVAQALMLPITLTLFIAVTAAFVNRRHPRKTNLLLGWRRPTWRDAGIGLGAGIVALVVLAWGVGNVLQWIAQALETELPEVQEQFQTLARDRSTAPLLVLSAVVIAPIAEELFFRGMLFQALRKHFSVWPAVGTSAVLFAMTHIQRSTEGYLMVLLIIIPLGMLLAYLYERRGTLLVPILIHATFNLIQVTQLITTPA